MTNKNERGLQDIAYAVRGSSKQEPEDYIVLPEKVIEKKYVTINGIRYQDITEYIIDCGG